MGSKSDQELWEMTFRMLGNVAKALKAEGLETEEIWALVFTTVQDLQAADFGMGSTAHEDALRMQRDSLAEDLQDLEAPPLVQ